MASDKSSVVSSTSDNPSGDESEAEDCKRGSRRQTIAIPVTVRIAGKIVPPPTHALNVGPRGIFVVMDNPPREGTLAKVSFEAMAEELEPVAVEGKVARRCLAPVMGMGFQIDTKKTPSDQMRSYRNMVMYCIRHPPIANEADSSDSEA